MPESKDPVVPNPEVVAAIKRAAALNESLQNKHAKGSSEWHSHESIDDHLFNALELLGD